MARTFNGNIWSGIGDKVARDAMLRRKERKESMGGLLDMAKFLEKANASRRLRQDWQDYFANKKAAQEAAAEDAAAQEAAQDLADAQAEEDSTSLAALPPVVSIFGKDMRVPENTGIWDPSMIAYGYQSTPATEDIEFMKTFNPNTASKEDKRIAQGIIGAGVDGIWGPESRMYYKKFMGGV